MFPALSTSSSLGLASSVFAATELPLLGMTIGTDGAWSARFWDKTAPRQFERCWCGSLKIVMRMLNSGRGFPPRRRLRLAAFRRVQADRYPPVRIRSGAAPDSVLAGETFVFLL